MTSKQVKSEGENITKGKAQSKTEINWHFSRIHGIPFGRQPAEQAFSVVTVFQANGDKREEQNVILSRSSPRPNNLDITVSFGNIPIILIIPFINAFVLLGLMSKPREKKSCTWNTSAKKKKRNNNDRNNNQDDNNNNNNNDNDNNYNDNNSLLLLNVVNCDETKLFLIFV